MEHYALLKTLHIVSGTVLFGTGLGTAFQMWMAHRSGDVRALALVTRNVVIADWLFTAPAAIVQPLTGVLLARAAGFDLFAPWLVATYALYLLAAVCWLPVVAIQIRLRDLSADAALNNRTLDSRYAHLIRWWFWLGWPAFGALIAVFWLMVTKPALWL